MFHAASARHDGEGGEIFVTINQFTHLDAYMEVLPLGVKPIFETRLFCERVDCGVGVKGDALDRVVTPRGVNIFVFAGNGNFRFSK